MANAMDATEPHVLVRRSGSLGRVTLNRPRALNALQHDMIVDISSALDVWRADSHIDLVLLDGAGDRGLCAGGDVRQLYEQIRAGLVPDTARFFRDEYRMNAAIAEYRVPVIALADGITMGGGIGLAGHAAIRVVTERSRLAMPETRIGFTPDVGGSWLLAHAPGRLGEYLALTGAEMDASDAMYAGFADHLVPSARLDALRAELEARAHPTGAGELVLLFDDTALPSRLAAARAWIDDAFAGESVADIVQRLRARPEPEAAEAADTLETLSPVALTVTLAAVRRARELPDLRAALAQEFGLVMWFVQTQPDLVEGIRAQVIDKDRAPRWNPASLADVPASLVDDAFAFRPPVPLWDA